MREDLQGEPRAPKSTTDWLTRVGGKAPFYEPLYRLVHTNVRRCKRGGRWKDWDHGLSIQERGGLKQTESGIIVPYDTHPQRVVDEIRWVLKYPTLPDRWILERWMPGAFYGSRDNWNRMKIAGTDLLALGPYPEQGDYEMVGATSEPALPTLTFLKKAMEECEYNNEQHRKTVEEMVREQANEAQYEYEKQMLKLKEEDIAFFRDQLSPWNRISLAAGRWRSELAKRAGVNEHAGN